MKETSSARPILLVHRACSFNRDCLNVLLFFVALVLCTTVPSLAKGARGSESTFSIRVSAGWNLMSLPASVSDGRKDFLFPSAVSSAYIFHQQTGYQELDTLHNGVGFWLKFDSSETVLIQGDMIFRDTIEVQAGWNLIGSLSVPVPVDSIKTEPPGIITSPFFGYIPGGGYQQADTLYPGLGYWVKVNQVGSIVLSIGPGSPCPGIPTVFYAGKTYNTVQIGSQCWLRENLDVGTMINGTANQTNNSIIEKYCYNNDTSNCNTFGGLYQWDETMQYSTTPGVQGICPPGWHIPTYAEFQTLSATVGGDGNALKAIGQGYGGGAGTNTSGFSALLAGYCYFGGYFNDLGNYATIWSSTQNSATYAHYLYLHYYYGSIYVDFDYKVNGFSVRCLED